MAFLRDMHAELKAQQRVLLGLELTPAEVQQRIRNVKKTFPTIKTQTRRDYDQLLKSFETEVSSSGVRNAAKILLPKVQREAKKNV